MTGILKGVSKWDGSCSSEVDETSCWQMHTHDIYACGKTNLASWAQEERLEETKTTQPINVTLLDQHNGTDESSPHVGSRVDPSSPSRPKFMPHLMMADRRDGCSTSLFELGSARLNVSGGTERPRQPPWRNGGVDFVREAWGWMSPLACVLVERLGASKRTLSNPSNTLFKQAP